MVIKGHQKDIIHKIPLHEYDALFTKASPTDCIGKTNPTEIREQLTLVQKKSLEIITSLSENDLNTKLEPTKTAHPIATNKYEALDWNIKHTMWHCGQLGILKRVLDKKFDFGLQNPQ